MAALQGGQPLTGVGCRSTHRSLPAAMKAEYVKWFYLIGACHALEGQLSAERPWCDVARPRAVFGLTVIAHLGAAGLLCWGAGGRQVLGRLQVCGARACQLLHAAHVLKMLGGTTITTNARTGRPAPSSRAAPGRCALGAGPGLDGGVMERARRALASSAGLLTAAPQPSASQEAPADRTRRGRQQGRPTPSRCVGKSAVLRLSFGNFLFFGRALRRPPVLPLEERPPALRAHGAVANPSCWSGPACWASCSRCPTTSLWSGARWARRSADLADNSLGGGRPCSGFTASGMEDRALCSAAVPHCQLQELRSPGNLQRRAARQPGARPAQAQPA